MKIEGKNCVLEALRSGQTVNGILCEKGANGEIIELAKASGVKIQYADKSALDRESLEGRHQGFIADIVDFEYCEIEDILAVSDKHFIVILDGLNDPHNLGSIMRVCECAGVDGIIIGKNRQVAVNETVVRCSAGAAAYVKVARVTNINEAVKTLQKNNVWVYSCDMDGSEITKVDLKGSIALIIGGEGGGISKLTKSLSDGVVSLKLKGKVNSLNASVACGIAVYEAVRQRG